MTMKPLPSSDGAARWVNGDGSLTELGLHTIGRGVIIGVGLRAAGFRGHDLVLGSLCAAVAIEVFALVWMSAQRSDVDG